MSNYRTIKYPLESINSLSTHDAQLLNEFYEQYEKYFQETVENIDVLDIISWSEITSKGNFRDRFLQEYGKPYLEWSIDGEKAKYYRIIIGQIRQQARSIKERIEVSRICHDYDYDISQLSEIRKSLIEAGLYPTNSTIKNICKYKGLPDTSKMFYPVLDFTIEDSQVSTVKVDNNTVDYAMKIFSNWVKFSLPLPVSNMRENTHIARPIIQRDKTTGELYLRLSYKPVILDHTFNNDLVIGIDQGKKKPFAGSLISKDGSYSTELTYTKEIENVAHKITILEQEKSYLYDKKSEIEALMTGVDTQSDTYFDLLLIYGGLKEQISYIRNKQSRLRENLSWLIARDVVDHCVHYNVGVIKLETLSVFENTGKWNHADVVDKLKELTALHGIQVFLVNAKDTSHNDPFTDDHVTANNKRLVNISIGVRDRDYVASLEIARRPGKNANKKKRKKNEHKKNKIVLTPKKSRDKHAPTPKRPKPTPRKKVWKQQVKPDRLMERRMIENSITGYDIAVHNLGVDSVFGKHTARSSQEDINDKIIC